MNKQRFMTTVLFFVAIWLFTFSSLNDCYAISSDDIDESFLKIVSEYILSNDTSSDISIGSLDIETDLYKPKTVVRWVKSKQAKATASVNTTKPNSIVFTYGDTVNVVWPVSKDAEYATIMVNGLEYLISRSDLSYNEIMSDDIKTKALINNGKFVGLFQLTAYAWTGNRCANGRYPTKKYTVAAHKKDFPLGSRLYIEGYGVFTVEDRGGFKKGVIDIYLGDHNQCVQFGRKHNVKVYLLK